ALQTNRSTVVAASRFDSAVTSRASVTSSLMTSAAFSASARAAFGWRQQPMTSQPAPPYWRANSRPRPRLAPVIRTVGIRVGGTQWGEAERSSRVAERADQRAGRRLEQLPLGQRHLAP